MLARFLSDWASIYKTARALSRARGGCVTVRFYSAISCRDFDSSGELLENNYAKETQSREPTNIMKYRKNLKMFFSLLLISDLNTEGPKNSNITYQFSAGTS
jgi:hypothetical protein